MTSRPDVDWLDGRGGRGGRPVGAAHCAPLPHGAVLQGWRSGRLSGVIAQYVTSAHAADVVSHGGGGGGGVGRASGGAFERLAAAGLVLVVGVVLLVLLPQSLRLVNKRLLLAVTQQSAQNDHYFQKLSLIKINVYGGPHRLEDDIVDHFSSGSNNRGDCY